MEARVDAISRNDLVLDTEANLGMIPNRYSSYSSYSY